jgi:hypothetical protein
MDQDLAVKKKKSKGTETYMESRYFGAPLSPKKSADHLVNNESIPEAGPSHTRAEKENVPVVIDDDCDISMEVALEFEEPVDPVTQEDGYISPLLECPRWETPELSSPVQPRSRSQDAAGLSHDDFGADPISSPLASRKTDSYTHTRRPRSASPTHTRSKDKQIHERGRKALVRKSATCGEVDAELVGPDLRDMFGEDSTSEIDSFEGECQDRDGSAATLSSPTPETPDDTLEVVEARNAEIGGESDGELDSTPGLTDPVEIERLECERRGKVVGNGWREKWALDTKAVVRQIMLHVETPFQRVHAQPTLRRHETTVGGHYQPIRPYSHSPKPGTGMNMGSKVRRRTSLVFLKESKKARRGGQHTQSGLKPESHMDPVGDVLPDAQRRLAQFRWEPMDCR